MKKVLLILIVLIAIFTIVACTSKEEHKHTVTGELIVVKESSCGEDGIAHMFCTECGEIVNTVAIPKTNIHTEIEIPEVESTCKEKGLSKGTKCSVCDAILVAQQEAPLKTHTYDNDEDATCNYCGYERYCVHRNTMTLETVAPTCTSIGLTEGTKCVDCEEIIVAQEVIDAKGHNFGEWVTVKEATTNEEGLQERICACGQKETDSIPIVKPYVRDGNYIYFGEYPQTIKSDNVTITSSIDSRGYYLGSDGSYYAMITATPRNSNYSKFSNGALVTEGTVYYFKVEPIRWRILNEGNGETLLLCDTIIAAHRFDDNSNNYAESEIRAWLNATFYEMAFSTIQQEIILTTEVKNNVCENTNDKIFLLSAGEVTNSEYGFPSDDDIARRMLTSDYSMATGVTMIGSSNGYWWLRTSYVAYATNAWYVESVGRVNNHSITNVIGVVSALRIRL